MSEQNDGLAVVSKTKLEQKLGGGLRKGSLRELVKKADVEGALLLLDVSGSMGSVLSTGQRAIDALRQIVADVRSQVIVPAAAFGLMTATGVAYVDEIPDPCGGTPLHAAIAFGREQSKSHLIVISDGMPDSGPEAMSEARKFTGKIDAIYVGDDGGPGAQFMRDLAKLTGGSGSVGDLTQHKALTAQIRGLLGDGNEPKKGAIQL